MRVGTCYLDLKFAIVYSFDEVLYITVNNIINKRFCQNVIQDVGERGVNITF